MRTAPRIFPRRRLCHLKVARYLIWYMLLQVIENYNKLVENPAVGGDSNNLPGNHFFAGFQSAFYSVFDAAAAGNFHAYHGDAFNVVIRNDLSKFFSVVAFIQLRTANERDLVSDKVLVEIPVRIGSAIRGNKQIGIVKIGRINGNQFDLHRPLG